ncbi:MAG: transposase [Acidimicrobiales bacterium]
MITSNVSSPARQDTLPISRRAALRSSHPICPTCPLRARCTKAAARSFSVTEHDAELVEARRAWRDDKLRASYRTHRPMVERSISWLVAKGNRRLRYPASSATGPGHIDASQRLTFASWSCSGLTRRDDNWVLAGT